MYDEIKSKHVFLGKMVPPTFAHIDLINEMIEESVFTPEIHTTRKTQYGVTVDQKLWAWHHEVVPVLTHPLPLYVSDDLWAFTETIAGIWDEPADEIVIWGGADRKRDLLRAQNYMNGFCVHADVKIREIARGPDSISGTRARNLAKTDSLEAYQAVSPCQSLFYSLTTHK